jgi:hypothetical protein
MKITDIQVAGIRRGSKYSPNHINNDGLIFELTANELRKQGCHVVEYTEEEFISKNISQSFIFGMVRNKNAVRKMQALENSGATTINSGASIENCFRTNMTKTMLSSNVPHPKSVILNTSKPNIGLLKQLSSKHFWLKRGDFHAIYKGDVSFARNEEEAKELLNEFALRGIDEAVVSEHLEGDLIKFYGVQNTPFFHWFYPVEVQHSKFGLEAINGECQNIPFDQNALRSIASNAAAALTVEIYGGDAIVSPNGDIRVIDLNDWPSFAPCREEASKHIANRIYTVFNNIHIPKEEHEK